MAQQRDQGDTAGATGYIIQRSTPDELLSVEILLVLA